MLIQWSDEDQVYVVTLPEFQGCRTHGSTYEEAARHGQEALESLVEAFQAEGRPLPDPELLDTSEDFWRTLEERRQQPSVPLEKLKAEVLPEEGSD
jgi:predicted RNase H-like HicB family nuclease